MEVKIIKCSNPNYWYVDKIGDIFKAIYDQDEYGYYIKYNGWITENDCEIVSTKNVKKLFPPDVIPPNFGSKSRRKLK